MRYTDFIPELKKGDELFDKGRFDEALMICDEVLVKMPDHAGALDLKCVCFLRLGRIDEAEKAIRAALKHLDCNAALYTHLGDVLVKQNKEEEALQAYEHAIRFDNSFAPGFLGRGRVRMFHLYDREGSIRDFTKALELDPKESEAWFLRGLCRLGTQLVPEAQQDFREALKIDPGMKERIGKTVEEFLKVVHLPGENTDWS